MQLSTPFSFLDRAALLPTRSCERGAPWAWLSAASDQGEISFLEFAPRPTIPPAAFQ